MKITLEKKQLDDGGAIYSAQLFGQKITLSKALVAREKEAGRFKKEMEVGADWFLTATAKEKNGKTYTNFYFTVKKPKAEAAPTSDSDGIPF